MGSRKTTWLAGSLALGCTAVAAQVPPVPQKNPVTVQAQKTLEPPAPRRKDLACILEPSLEVNLGSQVDGVIAEMKVERGSVITKGQVLVRLNANVEAASVDLARGKAAFASRKAERNEELYAKQLISQQEKDQLETERRLAQLELREKQEMLRLRTITSPINGVVVDRYLSPGDQIATKQIFKLAQINPLHVEVVAPVELFGTVKVGTVAEVSMEPLLKGTYAAKVTVIDRVIDAASGTFRVRLELPNPRNEIPAGLRCKIKFPGAA